MQTPVDIRIDRLTAEISELRHEIRQLLKSTPKPGIRWVSTAQFAQELNLTSRTISAWLAAGRFPSNVYKKKRRGTGHVYLLDREPALKAAERIMTT